MVLYTFDFWFFSFFPLSLSFSCSFSLSLILSLLLCFYSSYDDVDILVYFSGFSDFKADLFGLYPWGLIGDIEKINRKDFYFFSPSKTAYFEFLFTLTVTNFSLYIYVDIVIWLAKDLTFAVQSSSFSYLQAFSKRSLFVFMLYYFFNINYIKSVFSCKSSWNFSKKILNNYLDSFYD